MDDLKRELGLSGRIRFLDRPRLLDDRVKDEAIAAKQSLLNAPTIAPPQRGVIAQPDGVAAALQPDVVPQPRAIIGRVDDDVEHSDASAAPPPELPPLHPIVANANQVAAPREGVPVAQQLPMADGWYHSDDYAVGTASRRLIAAKR